ncbi:MAG: hypothetical protein KGH60_02945 [Candidatus Micrarchaeota archaeon]|nr:hypothetical protein [Candidatus Micrarchaeota archaeon]
MSIDSMACDVCGDELSVENYYYISAGRLQQGPMSDPKAITEYTLCMTCYNQIKAELLVSIARQKNRKLDEKKEKDNKSD